MHIKPLANCLTLLLALSILFILAGCGGGNNESGANTNTVQGNVAQVMTAMETLETEPTQVVRWWQHVPAFVAIAHAQGTDLSGITVMAQLNGATLDTTVTDASGDFTLNVSGGDLTLVFLTDAYELTLTITVPDNSDVSLTVSLQPEDADTPVVVEAMDVMYQPIVCTSDTMTLTSDSDYVIHGDGDTCIRATGNCTIETAFDKPVHIQLMNCGYCIRAAGNAEINLLTEGSVTCVDALIDGIHTRGRAEVNVQANETITFSAAEDGIDASGNSSVYLSAEGMMTDEQAIPGEESTAPVSVTGTVGVHAQGNATVEIDARGDCIVEGTTENLSQSGNASITAPCTPAQP